MPPANAAIAGPAQYAVAAGPFDLQDQRGPAVQYSIAVRQDGFNLRFLHFAGLAVWSLVIRSL